jgi:hypothetical protein
MNYVCTAIALTLSFWQKKRPKKTVFVQPVSVFRVRGISDRQCKLRYSVRSWRGLDFKPGETQRRSLNQPLERKEVDFITSRVILSLEDPYHRSCNSIRLSDGLFKAESSTVVISAGE